MCGPSALPLARQQQAALGRPACPGSGQPCPEYSGGAHRCRATVATPCVQHWSFGEAGCGQWLRGPGPAPWRGQLLTTGHRHTLLQEHPAPQRCGEGQVAAGWPLMNEPGRADHRSSLLPRTSPEPWAPGTSSEDMGPVRPGRAMGGRPATGRTMVPPLAGRSWGLQAE